MALGNREDRDYPLIYQSDRGLQYCSNDYQKLLSDNDINPSMSEKYDLYKNAIAERINGILKQEFNIAKSTNNFDIKKKTIEKAILICNNVRPHLSNHILRPL
jgi:transposase InsO family protein